jgi:hypothetical protein
VGSKEGGRGRKSPREKLGPRVAWRGTVCEKREGGKEGEREREGAVSSC